MDSKNVNDKAKGTDWLWKQGPNPSDWVHRTFLFRSSITLRMSGPEDEWWTYSYRNIRPNVFIIGRFSTILVSIDSSHSQLSIDANITTDQPILMPFTSVFWFHLMRHSLSGVIEHLTPEVQQEYAAQCTKLWIFWNQNMATNGCNIFRFFIQVMPFESWDHQLSNCTNFIENWYVIISLVT